MTIRPMILGILFIMPSAYSAGECNQQFLMAASRAELVQAYMAQCQEKDLLYTELRRLADRNKKLEHDHFGLKAEYLIKGLVIGGISWTAGFLIFKVLSR